MSSLSPVGRSAAANKNDRSAAARKVDRSAVTHKNDRVSLCSFTFADGRRCRTPLNRNHPHFCFYHAQKEARSTAAQKLGKDLAYFFSGDYLSACDLSTALARLIPAVVRGDVKPRAARTVAYLAQTLMQAIHISQHEYCEAFSSDTWRRSIRNSVKGNHNYRFPPAPKPQPPAPHPAAPTEGALNVAAGRNLSRSGRETGSLPATSHVQPSPSPHTPTPPTSTEFVQHVLAGRNLSRPGPETGDFQASSEHQIHSARSGRPEPVLTGDPDPLGRGDASRPASPPKATPSSPSASPTTTGATPPVPPPTQAQQPASQPAKTPAAPPVQPNKPPQTTPPPPPRGPDRDAPWLNFSPTSNIPPDSKLL